MRATAITVATAMSVSSAAAAPAAPAAPSSAAWTEGLGAEDPREVDRAVTAITATPAVEPDVLFAAGRACEDKLDDPGRAAIIYERIVTAYPDARVVTSAVRRLAELRPLVGAHGETAALAAELAQLTAHADALAPVAVWQRAGQLASTAWPGAPSAALWLADWLRRARRLVEAQAGYALVIARWPQSVQAHDARRGAVSAAIDARDWPLAERLADRLPSIEPADRAIRDDLRAAVARGQRRARWYTASGFALAFAFAALLASLAEAMLRSPRGTRWSALRPPIEIVFLAPVAAVLIGVAFTAHRLIAPAVATISIGGLVLAYLSGATLERLRQRGRRARLRSLAHVVLCIAGVAALAYVALTHGELLDLLLETVRFGPEN